MVQKDKLQHEGVSSSEAETQTKIFRLAFESSPNAILIIDDNGKITLVNLLAEELFGYTRAELIGQQLEILVPNRLRRQHNNFRVDFFQRPETRSMGIGRDLMAQRKDGTEFPVEIGLTSMATDHGNVVMAVVVDITKRKRAEEERMKLEEQIQQTQKLESLGVLAGGIAHDFNNLLTGILGNADLALLELSPVSPARRTIEDIQISAIRAAELCKQMLAYSGKGKFVIKPISLNEVINETTHLLQLSISKNAVINYHLFPELPAIEGDPTQIRQVMMNLVTNASEAIGDKSGVITITTGVMECDRSYLDETFFDDALPEGFYVYLEIADTGIGIPPENLQKIFDPFFTTKATGRGLGLAALMGIVRSHKGAIRVYSEVGIGTTIKIIFPSSEQLAEKSEENQLYDEEWQISGKILIIDDDESVRAVVRKALEKKGFTVLTAPDGKAGLATIDETEDLRLVILDLTMPHMDGAEVLRNIRQRRLQLPVILTSGYNEHEVVNRFVGKGITDFIQKPIRLQVLLTKVNDALRDGKA